MRSRWFRVLGMLVILASTALVLASCGDEVSADEPPKIKFGEDTCSRCNMIISEEKYAAALVDKDGKAMIFDDIGEMIVVVQEEGLNDRRAWVHDYDTVEWVDATKAFFMDSHENMTPMGTAVVAFGTREAAEKLATERSGTVRDWNTTLVEWEMHGHH